MKNTDNIIFKGLQVVAWILFVALCIEAGAILVNFILSWYWPQVVHHLYKDLDLSEIYNRSRSVYFIVYSLILTTAISKAYLFYLVILLLRKLDLSHPFNHPAAAQILRISYCTLAIGFLSLFGKQLIKNLAHRGFSTSSINQFWTDAPAFILMGAVIYIIATIFKKGVDLQSEIDLTV